MGNAVSPENFQDLVDGIPANFKRVVFGSPVEAKIGGSYASFRQSDSIDFISQQIASGPVSMIDRYPDIISQIRSVYGLSPLFGNPDKPPATVPILDTGIDPNSGNVLGAPSYNAPSGDGGGYSFFSWQPLQDWVDHYAMTVGWFLIGLIVLAVGGFMLVYSTDTGKKVVNKGAKAGAEAIAA